MAWTAGLQANDDTVGGAGSLMRGSWSLDGSEWAVRDHLGLDAALSAAARSEAGSGWIPASVPGSVLDDVRRHGDVADPFVERNSLGAEWVPARTWTYQRRFDLPEIAAGERAWLRFGGVDHACHVFVDGEALGSHTGMFVPFEVPLPPAPGQHTLSIVIEPAPPGQPQLGRTSLVRTMRPRMTEGWDFCPRLPHLGIWRSVTLEIGGELRIGDVWARPRLSDDLSSATVDVQVTLDVARPQVVRIEAELVGASAGRAETSVAAAAGSSEATLQIEVQSPALWWPNGMGRAAIHHVHVRAAAADDAVVTRTVPVGFRKIERVSDPSAPAGARPWSFVVNGRPMYVTGWNWVPMDALYGVPRPGRLDHLLDLAVRAHVNLVRVWGGGLIETEEFYDACDRLGLLVWQEFPLSSSGGDSVPATGPGFVKAVATDAEAIVPQRRNHPSLAIWCAGNELENDCGAIDDAPVIEALRSVVEQLDPDRGWLPTSPSGPRRHNTLAEIAADPDGQHDVHGPWEHQGLRGQQALYDAGRSLFSSEFGTEGMTNRRTHEALIAPEQRLPADRSNPVYRHLGDWWNNEPLVQAAYGGRLRGLDDLRRASQGLQADGLQYAIEANRRRAPRHGGSIPWQFNESFPNAWCTAAVDHRGDPKPAYRAVARAYAATHVCARFESVALAGAATMPISVWAWSADDALDRGVVRWRLVDLDGTELAGSVADVVLGGPTPVEVDAGVVAVPGPPPLFFLDLALLDETGTQCAANRYIFAGGDDLGSVLDVSPATVSIRVEDEGTGTDPGGSTSGPLSGCLVLEHGNGPAALGVRIEDDRPIDEAGWLEAEDDAFDLLPGEVRRVRVRWRDAPADVRRISVSGWNLAPVVLG
jgi:beta-mannosidase